MADNGQSSVEYLGDRLADAYRENERLRAELQKLREGPEWTCTQGHRFRYQDGHGCPTCMASLRAERDLLRASINGFLSVFSEEQQRVFWEAYEASREGKA